MDRKWTEVDPKWTTTDDRLLPRARAKQTLTASTQMQLMRLLLALLAAAAVAKQHTFHVMHAGRLLCVCSMRVDARKNEKWRDELPSVGAKTEVGRLHTSSSPPRSPPWPPPAGRPDEVDRKWTGSGPGRYQCGPVLGPR